MGATRILVPAIVSADSPGRCSGHSSAREPGRPVVVRLMSGRNLAYGSVVTEDLNRVIEELSGLTRGLGRVGGVDVVRGGEDDRDQVVLGQVVALEHCPDQLRRPLQQVVPLIQVQLGGSPECAHSHAYRSTSRYSAPTSSPVSHVFSNGRGNGSSGWVASEAGIAAPGWDCCQFHHNRSTLQWWK